MLADKDKDFQIHFKRPINSCFVNNYFIDGLRAWEANIVIQLVINHYKAVSYMCVYFLKLEDESTEAMKQAVKEAMKSNKSAYEQMKSIARAYITKRECSVQEAVYHVIPELWLRKAYPTVIFINTNLPEKRFRICCCEEELSELPEDSTDVFKRNMLHRYIDRPNETYKNGRYRMVDKMCFAEYFVQFINCKSENVIQKLKIIINQMFLKINSLNKIMMFVIILLTFHLCLQMMKCLNAETLKLFCDIMFQIKTKGQRSMLTISSLCIIRFMMRKNYFKDLIRKILLILVS